MPKCPTCEGLGKIIGLFPVPAYTKKLKKKTKCVEFKCDRCKGSGKISKEGQKWIIDGNTLKDRRIDKLMTLRNAVRFLKMDPIKLSQMERGIIKPDLTIHYQTIKIIVK